ncbi:MAG: penicillin-binding protein 1A [Betaproteobacteria bacterium]|jgi:penicillin-binding protein 1A|nr:penicillin-binding protein 1A [Betaproteobacteria bacterium]
MKKIILYLGLASIGGMIAGAILLVFAIIIATPNLPSLEAVTDYQPKVPLRIYSADEEMIGEFGEERRNVTPIAKFPDALKKAVLSIEDDRFYEHHGVDFQGVARAALVNLGGGMSQGASTITMQVARNFFLSNEKTLTRKLYEILLAWKIEQNLSKDKILELYMNQIYLGQRSYGFASAARIYFGKNVNELSIAESAMLAGLPKAPSAYNPVVNFRRAKIRQEYILQRMRDLKYISSNDYAEAMLEELLVKGLGKEFNVRADYVAEYARQLLVTMYGENVYVQGLKVYTTVKKAHQEAAYQAVRKGILDYDLKHGYRGPEGFVEIPNAAFDSKQMKRALDEALISHSSSDEIQSGVVLEASSSELKVFISSGEMVSIKGAGLSFVKEALSPSAQPKLRIKKGSIVRVMPSSNNTFQIVQMPEVESALISLNPQTGAILAMSGGFDFRRGQFNHAMQAQRQPGSSFKPFIYAAALEKGIMPRTLVNDAYLSIGGAETGSKPWEPKNYDGKTEGLMTVRAALARSKNLATVRIIRAIGPVYAQSFIQKFGFEAEKHPPYLTLALGAGSATPLQMAVGYSIFANGGYGVEPYLISRIVDMRGKIIFEASPQAVGDESLRVLDERTAFVADSLLQEVTRSGTAASARVKLSRTDIAGKTGTTNDAHDAWFAGYHPKVSAVVWMGFDKPRSLGSNETGGGLSLPVWINYMTRALADAPDMPRVKPAGVEWEDGDWVIPEFTARPKYPSLKD